MAETDRTGYELFQAKAVTDDDVNRLVEAVLDGSTDWTPLADGYTVNLAAAVEASAFSKSALSKRDSAPATRSSPARTAILLARADKA